ncbi:MAG: RNA polymerase subunit sigma, partial [Fuerstiella sp.]|nr:RNA polymerase subunit sigma [Fuerstiella sp.]
MDSPEDNAELLRRCQRGDEDALTELVDRFEDRVYRLALRMAGDPALAQEVTADSFY